MAEMLCHYYPSPKQKTPDHNWCTRAKHQHLYATTPPGYDTWSGGSPPFCDHHWHFRCIWTATYHTRRCAKNTLLITTRNLCQQHPPTRGLQWTIILAKVHDVCIPGLDRHRGVGIPWQHLHILEDYWGAQKCPQICFQLSQTWTIVHQPNQA